MDYKFASFSSFNSTGKAVKPLSASDNYGKNFKRPTLTVNHISLSIIRGVFPKLLSIVFLDTIASVTFIQLCQALPHIAKVFAPFTFSYVIHVHLLSLRVFSLQKIECTFDGISTAFLLRPISDVFPYFLSLKPPIQRDFR